MRISKLKKLSLAVCLAIMPLSVYAVGLGKLNVTSSLGEPFRAEVDLISATPEELETLTAVIASEQAYDSQGISRLGIHQDMRVEIASNTGETSKVVLTSSRVVTDPYLDMLIQLDWASGRLQREYTVLLDPPGYKDSIAKQITEPVSPPIAEIATALSEPEISLLPTPMPEIDSGFEPSPNNVEPMPVIRADAGQRLGGNKSEAEIAAEIAHIEAQAKATVNNGAIVATNPVMPPAEYVPVERPLPVTNKKTVSGDTLSGIASTMRVPGVSLNQMLVGLYEYNKEAFVDDNMNRLKVGKVIKLPSKDTLISMSRSQASQTVVLHTDNWRGYRDSLATSITTSNHVELDAEQQSETGIIAKVEPEKPMELQEEKDVVKLSAGEQTATNDDAKITAEVKKSEEMEDKIAADKELAEAEDRTASVEKQIEDMQKLLAMKNKAMKDLQDKAETDNNSTLEVVPEGEAEVVEEVVKTDEVEVITPEPEQPAEPEQQPEAMGEVNNTKAVDLDAQEDEGFFASLKSSFDLPVLGALGSILLLIGGWLFLRNKRKKDLESFERGILTSGGLRANTVFGNTTGNTSTTDTSFLTDFAQTTDGAMMDTNEVDPIAEAEVYMAYGREAQAEEILKDAIKKEPTRYELHVKLLEIFSERKDTSAFETVASELYTTLGSDDPKWKQVAEMGRALEPSNPLYDQEDEPASSVATPQNIVSNEVVATTDDVPVLDSVVEPVAKKVEPIVDMVKGKGSAVSDKVSDVATDVSDKAAGLVSSVADKAADATDAVTDKAKGISGKTAAIAGLATAAVAKGVSRIESIVKHEPAAEVDVATTSTTSGMDVVELENLEPDLELTLDAETDAVVDTPENDDLKAFDLSGISLEMGDEEENAPAAETTLTLDEVDINDEPEEVIEIGAAAPDGDENEVEIKLNLVAAYIDMDDKEGARELLDEVLKEGSEDQVMRAQMMMDSLA